jgi:cytochrome c
MTFNTMAPESMRRGLMPAVLITAVVAAFGVRAQSPADQSDPTRFTRSVLLDGLSEPMELEFDDAGRVYWIERVNRSIRRLDERTGTVETLGSIPAETVSETGVIGFALAPDFSKSKHIYVNYAGPVTPREMRLSRFTLGAGDQIDLASEKIMLRWFWEPATHMGGGMTWDSQGNLYLATGDDTGATQYSAGLGPTGADASRTSSNSNEYRGKILRIHPEPDGSYTIPPGNLFPPGTPQTKPEIFTMGNRNPWRLSVDSATGHLHWGEVGPDGGVDSPTGDPRGYDEFNIAHRAGNFGWPYQIGYDLGYRNYNHETGQFGPPMDPARPINPSPRNTGLRELPAAVPAALAYPYAISEEFPHLNGGGRMAVGGPVYRAAEHRAAARPWPAFFEGKWIIGDFVRNWIMVATLNQDRTRVTSLERLVPDERFNSIMDLDFGPTGDLYVLEYGHQGVAANSGARLSKIVFNAGNRAPRVVASADRTAGALPFQVQLSSNGTLDHDGDALRYQWTVVSDAGGDEQRFADANPRVTLNRAGAYQVALTVADAAGSTGSAALTLVAGNEPPVVRLELAPGNRTFFMPGQPVSYRAVVSDREDKEIPDNRVVVTAEYVPSGLSPADLMATPDALRPNVSFRHLSAIARMAASDCRACHQPDAKTVGPSFREISLRYQGDASARQRLAAKVIAGGSGVWGPLAMAAHPDLTQLEALSMVDYILSTADASRAPERLPSRGVYRGGSEGVLQSQQAAMVALNASVAELQTAAAAARTALIAASMTLPTNTSNLEQYAAVVATAEQALAVARGEALAKLQASETRLTGEQIQTLVQQAAETAAPAGRGGGAGANRGAFVLRASYEDRGANGVAPIMAGDIVLLRPQVLRPEEAEVRSRGITFTPSRDPGFFIVNHGAYIGYRGLDLTGVSRIEVSAVTAFYNWPVMQGADVEARLGSPTGRLLGTFSIYPGRGGGRGGTQAPPPVSATMPDQIQGIHDVYFVFVNPAAKPSNQLMLLHSVAFRS